MDNLEDLRRQTQHENMVLTSHDHENRLTALEESTKKSFALTQEIHTALIGTLDKPGLVREIKDNSKFISECKKRHEEQQALEKKERIDWWKWAERGVITAVLAWITGKIKGAW